MSLVAGVARVPLDPPLGGPMMGYGARAGTARAVHDPLFARALYLAGGGECLLVELDVCLLAPAHAEAVRARIAERTGVAAERVLVGSIHTHSGPETGFVAWLGGASCPCVGVALRRRGGRRGAGVRERRTGAARCRPRRGAHRLHAASRADPDPDVLVVRVDRATSRRSPCLRPRLPPTGWVTTPDYSADWPRGVARRRVDAAGCDGALRARRARGRRSAHARAPIRDRGQSVGESFEVMESLGREVGLPSRTPRSRSRPTPTP
jgi:hypothetical protein